MHPVYISAEDNKSSEENYEHKAFQRPHRNPGQLELGATEIAEGRRDIQRQVVPSGGVANCHARHVWDSYKPNMLVAGIAEAMGVFFFTYCGQISTATYVLSKGAVGDILQIGIGYAMGIVFAIVVCGSTSGGHFHPAITIAQVIFKGFPIRKAPYYIVCQILGGFIASLMVYAQWRSEMLEMSDALTLAGERAKVFTAQGPAGVLALFPVPGRSLGESFATEFFSDIAIGLVIWSQLDAQNIFTNPGIAPYTIGLAFATIVWGNAYGSVSLNTARDLGARFACGTIWGKECYPKEYTALAALTNIPGTLLAVAIYTFFLSDTRRPPAGVAISSSLEDEKIRHLSATETHDHLLDERIARTISKGRDASTLQAQKSRK